MLTSKIEKTTKDMLYFILNKIPAWLINMTYDFYSRIYEGQMRLGLPVSQQLLQTQEETMSRAAGKLALTLYHIFLRTTGSRVPRGLIKLVVMDEVEKKRIKLTENVIILTREQLEYLTETRFQIQARYFPAILKEAGRRRILKESLKHDRMPAYFESEIEEREENGRGDYETVYYQDYTDEGKEIRFRRLASMESVTAGDSRPSVLLVPGFACNSHSYNMSNKYSLAKDLADMGHWVYLFDPRGMGINKGKFDPFLTVDTLIDYDLPAVSKSIWSRSKGKPMVLVGHSMGGLISQNMLLNWNLRRHWNYLDHLDSSAKAILEQIIPPFDEAMNNLDMIKGVVCLGTPKFFQKMDHVFWPIVLWLNHLTRIFKLKHVPLNQFFWAITQVPVVNDMTKVILNSNAAELNIIATSYNHPDDDKFTHKYLSTAMESVPLGLGFQFLKAIYNGEGFKRMDMSRLNYSEHYPYFPENIPVFHFYGTADPLAPISNLKYSQYYPHKIKKVYRLETPKDIAKVEILPERSQLIDFVVEGCNHVDLLYGKTAKEIIYPLLMRIIHEVWGNWTYEDSLRDLKSEERHTTEEDWKLYQNMAVAD
ncbi:MAG: alpha/beta fold hydrolase [Desulfobacterales bacterium]|nr:alpha/beta fold hydrolase [Desulfobacterales bacterium]